MTGWQWNSFTSEQIEQRQLCIGGSDAAKIMAGEWFDLWQEKTGKKPAPDLSRAIPVQIGRATEALNIAWFERETNHVVANQQYSVVHPTIPYMRATLDGTVETLDAVLDAKHINGQDGRKIADVLQQYTPQLTHNALCAGKKAGIICCFFGTTAWDWGLVEIDPFYAVQLEEREAEFWRYVIEDKEPPDAPKIEPPVPPEKLRTVDMSQSNSWVDAAWLWQQHRAAAKLFDGAVKDLKSMVERDVGVAVGGGVRVVRKKSGLFIEEDKQ